jgi:DNA recombination protein RmuC
MTAILLIAIGLVLIGLIVYVVREATVLKATAGLLQQELRQFKEGGFDRLIGEKLSALSQVAAQHSAQLVEHQKRAAETIQQFKTDLGTVRERLASLGELQGKVGELNDLLKPQQLRGELGEVIVRSLLADKLPKQFEEDYAFSNGKRVEFVIRLNDKLIPVDSKLQLEDYKRLREAEERERPALRAAFKRTVKQKIDEVKQYICPEEGTANFAFMVIPSEAVFYDLVANKDFTAEGGLYEYAQAQHVFLTSPLTFWAYLTTLEQGLKGLEIERRAEEVLAALQALAGDIRAFAREEFRLLGVHLRNAAGQYDKAEMALREVEAGLSALERVGAHQPQHAPPLAGQGALR